MDATKDEIADWIRDCPKDKRWIAILRDPISSHEYPAYCNAPEVLALKYGTIQRATQCFDKEMDIKEQLNSEWCFNFPRNSVESVEEKEHFESRTNFIAALRPDPGTAVSSVETNVHHKDLCYYNIMTFTGYTYDRSTVCTIFQFCSSDKDIKQVINSFLDILKDQVRQSFKIELESCCKDASAKDYNYCPVCGHHFDGNTFEDDEEIDQDSMRDGYLKVFGGLQVSNDVFENLESHGVLCGFGLDTIVDMPTKLITIEAIDSLISGDNRASDIEVVDITIGERIKVGKLGA